MLTILYFRLHDHHPKPMKNSLLSLFFLFSIFALAQGNEHHDIDVLIFRADYQNALIEVENQLDAQPGDPATLCIKGRILRGMGDVNQAIQLYEKALQKDPTCERCLADYALYFMDRSDLKKADSTIKLIRAPKLAYTEYVLAKLDLKNYSISAIIHLNKSIALDPMMAEYYGVRGSYRLANGMSLTAKTDIEAGRALDTANLFCKLASARLHAMNGDLIGARILCEGYLKADSSIAVLSLYSNILHHLGRFEESDAAIRKAIDFSGDNQDLHIQWAEQYYDREDMDGVCEQYTALLPLLSGPENAEKRAYLQREQEQLCNPNRSSYYYQRGIAAYNLKDFETAIEIYNRGLTKFPNSAMMLSFKANALIKLKSYAAAIPIYQKSLALRGTIARETADNSPDYSEQMGASTVLYTFVADIHMSLMECYQSTGQPELALTYADSGVTLMESLLGNSSITPYLSSAYVMRCELHLVQGKTELAEADLKKASELDPSSTVVPLTRVKIILGRYRLNDFHLFNSFAVYSLDEIEKLPAIDYEDLREDYSSEDLQLALKECNNVLEVEQNALGYFYRAHIKKILQDPSYLMDLRAAENLGQVLSYPLLGEDRG
ncbi:MAG: tetratricopeptide repeat protein [Bacteroidetes bacterium]|nr:MAG: tetratricopeptide repeat protein [Bacteroidota bacterium]